VKGGLFIHVIGFGRDRNRSVYHLHNSDMTHMSLRRLTQRKRAKLKENWSEDRPLRDATQQGSRGGGGHMNMHTDIKISIHHVMAVMLPIK